MLLLGLPLDIIFSLKSISLFKLSFNPFAALKAGALAMSYGYFDHAARILVDRRMSGWLSLLGVNNVLESLSEVSTAYGRIAMRQGFARQLRGLLPFLRRIMQMV